MYAILSSIAPHGLVPGTAVILCAMAIGVASGEPVTIWDLRDVDEPGCYERAFTLNEDATVAVLAVGAGVLTADPRTAGEDEPDPVMHVYAWIVDDDRREVAWMMTPANTQPFRRESEDRVFEGRIDLPSGAYTAYFTAMGLHFGTATRLKIFGYDIGKFRSRAGRYVPWDAFGSPERWRCRLRIVDADFPASGLVLGGEHPSDAAISMVPLGDLEYREQPFEVTAPVTVELSGAGELDYDGERFVDNAWLADATTREPIWRLTPGDADPAGGALKNQRYRRLIDLDPGQYVLIAQTDDSHSYPIWNETPPFDPKRWGVELQAVDPAERGRIVLRDAITSRSIAVIDRVGDSRYERVAFEVTRSLPVRIVGLGERLPGRPFVDYGWIERAPSKRIAWSMRDRDSSPAGGHIKNQRVVDAYTLEPGTYIVCYITDSSHSFPRWNVAEPDDPRAWGIAVYPTDPDLPEGVVRPVDVSRADPALISLAPTGDDTHRSQVMELPRTYHFRVVALGEGFRGRMYDRGWIENADTGRTVWDMTYGRTQHGGGAAKNRYLEELIELPKGKYRVHYETDPEHSFEHFNEAAPTHPELWGITLYPGDMPPLWGR